MKRLITGILFITLLTASLVLYRAATQEKFFDILTRCGLVKDMYRFGDLYTNTNLPAYKEETAHDTMLKKFVPDKKDANLKLYLIGDSYTQPGRVDAINFRSGFYQNGYDKGTEVLDTTLRNILIIERTERYLRQDIRYELENAQAKQLSTLESILSRNPNPDMFNTKKINERLQYLTGNNAGAYLLQEWKSMFNYYALNYTGNGVFVSTETHFVYLSETLDSSSILSPHHAIDANEAVEIINYLNQLYDVYKARGFEEVYFSLIPEKVRVYPFKGHDRFNSIFELLKSKNLKMPTISCLEALKNANERVFMTCDTHWNTQGINCWLYLVNEVLKQTAP